MPSTIKIKQGIALRADFAGMFFLEPADLNFAMLPFQCRSILETMNFKVTPDSAHTIEPQVACP